MARIRSIKPDFWSSEQVLELSRDARLLFIGLWNFADDKGRFKWSPKAIKAQIFPGDDDVRSTDIERWLSEAVRVGLLERYENGSVQIAQVTGWNHQRIDKPQKAKYPGPNDSGSIQHSSIERSGSVPGNIPPDGSEGGIKDRSDPPPYPPQGAGVSEVVPAWPALWACFDRSRASEYLAELAECWPGLNVPASKQPDAAQGLFAHFAQLDPVARSSAFKRLAEAYREDTHAPRSVATFLSESDLTKWSAESGPKLTKPASGLVAEEIYAPMRNYGVPK